MLPIQFILLIILAGLPGEIDAATGGALARTYSPLKKEVPAWLLVGTLLFWHLCLALFVLARTRRAIRVLHEPSASSSAISHSADQLFYRARWASIALTASYLLLTSLPDSVFHWLDDMPLLSRLPHAMNEHVPLFPELLFMTPAILTWLAIWTAQYYVESASHERILPYLLASERPVHDMPTLPQYLSMQARHNFFPLLFLLVKPLFMLLSGRIDAWFPNSTSPGAVAAQVAASLGGTLIIFLILPGVLIRIWSTTPLLGPLRQRLDRVAALYRLRFRNILLWRTHHLVSNAAILGWIPFARYFLMSDSLLEAFSDRQLEAVFAHEVGHGVHRHIPWYLVNFLGAFALAGGITGITIYLLHLPDNGLAANILISVLVFICGALPFTFIAPRFEHQADWFACRHMARMIKEFPEAFAAPIPPATPLSTIATPAATDSPDLQSTLSPIPGPAETITLEQYAAGQYPNAGDHPPPMPPPSLPPATHPLQVPVSADTSSQAGAEIFISALDTLVESSHRARDRRGLMHPSINARIAILRKLASSPAAVRAL